MALKQQKITERLELDYGTSLLRFGNCPPEQSGHVEEVLHLAGAKVSCLKQEE